MNALTVNNKTLTLNGVTPLGVNIDNTDSVVIGNRRWSTMYLNYYICGIQPTNTAVLHDETISYYTSDQIQSFTFGSWHAPTTADFNDLLQAVGADNYLKLISTADGGTDDYGLHLYKSGVYFSTFHSNTDKAFFGVSTDNGARCQFYALSINNSPLLLAAPIRLVSEL